MQATRERVAVWLVEGRPVRIVWQGRRYKVNDTPTRLEIDAWWHPVMTHPLEPVDGWRFQARDAAGDVRLFDVRRVGDEWELLRVCE